MIKEEKVFAVFCDCCGTRLTEDDSIIGWTDMESAEFVARESGWEKQGDFWYCPDCCKPNDEEVEDEQE